VSVGIWLIGITTGVKRMITSVSRKFLTAESQFGASRTNSAGTASVGRDGISESMSLVRRKTTQFKLNR
jgi:hypothetical protein